MRDSLGLHIYEIENPLQIIAFLKNIYVGNILYTLCITSVKLSVLAFYWRLFEIKARITIYIVTAAAIAWCTAIVSHAFPHSRCRLPVSYNGLQTLTTIVSL